jgi:MFS family permease
LTRAAKSSGISDGTHRCDHKAGSIVTKVDHKAETATQSPADAMLPSFAYRCYILLLLTAISAISAIDRQVLDILVEPIRAEYELSDGQVGALNGLAYAGSYALAVIPLARLSDRFPRKLVISVCVFAWSLATTVSSFARSYAQLFVARIGVGLSEAGLSSPGPALISDIFPGSQRGTATSIYMTGPAIGIGIAYAVGGWVVTNYGWREALLVAGIPGLLLAPLFYLTVRNMPKGLSDGFTSDTKPPGLWLSLKVIFAIRTLRYLVLGLALQGIITQGVQRWIPAYLSRSQGLESVEFGAELGTALAVGNFIGHLAGGPLADLLGRRDMRLQFGLGFFAVVGVTLTNALLFTVSQIDALIVLAGLLSLLGGLFAAPLIMISTSLPPVWARAMTTAIALMGVYLFGFGLGPVLIGALSDLLVADYGEASLRYAVLGTTMLALPASALFLLAARHYRADLANSAASSPSAI